MTNLVRDKDCNVASRKARPTATRRKLLFALIPVSLLLLGTEIGLRLARFQYNPHDFTVPIFEATPAQTLRTNPFYLHQPLFRNRDVVFRQEFSPKKAGGAIRVLLVGGSSAFMLEDAPLLKQLLEQSLGRSVEIINMGMCGAKSTRLLLTIDRGLQLESDVIVVYGGHNEFSSPLSPDGYEVPPRGLRWEYRRIRIMQAIARLQDVRKDAQDADRAQGVTRVFQPSEKEGIYRTFDRNLREVARKCQVAHVPVVFGVVSSNRRLGPTMIEKDRLALTPAASRIVSEAVPKMYEEIALAEEASQNADSEEARRHYDEATILHPRPYRADRRIREIIRSLSGVAGASIANVDERIVEAAELHIPGEDLFGDHCHLNDRGREILQETLADTIVNVLQVPREGFATDDEPSGN